MESYYGSCEKETNKRLPVNLKSCFRYLEINEQGDKGDQHAVPNQVDSRDGDKGSKDSRKAPNKDSGMKYKKVLAQGRQPGK